jgi:hypothetical protein
MTAYHAAFSRGGSFPSLASIDESLHGRERRAALSRSSLSSRPQPFSLVALVYFQIGVAVGTFSR